jgi:hypothetical protein
MLMLHCLEASEASQDEATVWLPSSAANDGWDVANAFFEKHGLAFAAETLPAPSAGRSSGWQLIDGRWSACCGVVEADAYAAHDVVPVASSNAEAVGVASDAAATVPAGVPGQRAAANVVHHCEERVVSKTVPPPNCWASSRPEIFGGICCSPCDPVEPDRRETARIKMDPMVTFCNSHAARQLGGVFVTDVETGTAHQGEAAADAGAEHGAAVHSLAITDDSSAFAVEANAVADHGVIANAYDHRLPAARYDSSCKAKTRPSFEHVEFLPALLIAYKTVFSPRRANAAAFREHVENCAAQDDSTVCEPPEAGEHMPGTDVSGALPAVDETANIDARLSGEVKLSKAAKKRVRRRSTVAPAAVAVCRSIEAANTAVAVSYVSIEAANAAVEVATARPAGRTVREAKRAISAAEIAETRALARLNASEARLAMATKKLGKRILAEKRCVVDAEAELIAAKLEQDEHMRIGRARGHIP